MKRSKRYKNSFSKFEKKEFYTLEKAIEIMKNWTTAKFDETFEVHFNLGLDVRQADQQIRNSIVLPHGIGKDVKVLVFAEGQKADEAEKAGADLVGLDEYVEKIQNGWLEFDVVVATPNLMGKIGRLGRVLGPRGLMPNPKTGTVTMDVEKAVKEAKAGKVEYRTDKTANLHIPTGKLSFENQKLQENVEAIFKAVLDAKPTTAKGVYMKKMVVTSTMGPGIKIDTNALSTKIKK